MCVTHKFGVVGLRGVQLDCLLLLLLSCGWHLRLQHNNALLGALVLCQRHKRVQLLLQAVKNNNKKMQHGEMPENIHK
jgi:hypothetical protein